MSKELNSDHLPQIGEVLECRGDYCVKVIQVLSTSSFSNVFKVKNVNKKHENNLYVMKIEKRDCFRAALVLDANVLTIMDKTVGFPKIFSCGRTSIYNYIIMEYIGPNLEKLRKASPNKRFSVPTTLRLALQTLCRIETLHNAGFLSRDIKASNFAIGSDENDNEVYMFDFGLSRKYLGRDGKLLPPRKATAMLGTFLYAPLASHNVQEQCRRDDLESWFYMCVEMVTGNLPWEEFTSLEQQGEIAKCKRYWHTEGRQKFLELCPEEFHTIFEIIQSTKFFDAPNYKQLQQEIKNTFSHLQLNELEPFDWQKDRSILQLVETLKD